MTSPRSKSIVAPSLDVCESRREANPDACQTCPFRAQHRCVRGLQPLPIWHGRRRELRTLRAIASENNCTDLVESQRVVDGLLNARRNVWRFEREEGIESDWKTWPLYRQLFLRASWQ